MFSKCLRLNSKQVLQHEGDHVCQNGHVLGADVINSSASLISADNVDELYNR